MKTMELVFEVKVLVQVPEEMTAEHVNVDEMEFSMQAGLDRQLSTMGITHEDDPTMVQQFTVEFKGEE